MTSSWVNKIFFPSNYQVAVGLVLDKSCKIVWGVCPAAGKLDFSQLPGGHWNNTLRCYWRETPAARNSGWNYSRVLMLIAILPLNLLIFVFALFPPNLAQLCCQLVADNTMQRLISTCQHSETFHSHTFTSPGHFSSLSFEAVWIIEEQWQVRRKCYFWYLSESLLWCNYQLGR